MPGPHWKHSVQRLHKSLDRCQEQAEVIAQSGEIFKNGNTVVEVNIKTRKKQPSSASKSGKATVAAVHHRPAAKNWSKSLKKPVASKTEDVVDSGPKVFKKRTLQVFLNEMKAALGSDSAEGRRQVQEILNDMEFVTSNMEEADMANFWAGRGSPKSKVEPSFSKKETDQLREALAKSRATCKDQEIQIMDLKQALKQLSDNNNDMMQLLSKHADLEDKVKALVRENRRLSQLAEQSKRRADSKLQGTIKDLQAALKRDLKLYSTASAVQKPNLSKDITLNLDDSSSTEVDSAIGEGSSSRSQAPESQRKADELISNARLLLTQSQDKKVLLARPDPPPTTQEKATQAKPVQPIEPVAPDVDDFLKRIRSNKGLDITLPQLPRANLKSFDDPSISDFTATTTDANSTVHSLSESKFRMGLESSILLSSDPE